jgi:hypothetical protein
MIILSAEHCFNSTDALLWPDSVVSVVTTLSHVLLTEDFIGWRLLGKKIIFFCHLEGHWQKYQDSDPEPGANPDRLV